jgi:hypothetical protein
MEHGRKINKAWLRWHGYTDPKERKMKNQGDEYSKSFDPEKEDFRCNCPPGSDPITNAAERQADGEDFIAPMWPEDWSVPRCAFCIGVAIIVLVFVLAVIGGYY